MSSIVVTFSFCSFQGLFHVFYRNPQLQQPILDMFFNQVQCGFFLVSSYHDLFCILSSCYCLLKAGNVFCVVRLDFQSDLYSY